MSTHANQSNCSANRASAVRDVVTFREIVSIGATGAPSFASNDSDDPGITVTRSTNGTYTLAFPKGKRAWFSVGFVSAASTVTEWILTALDANAGTATLLTIAIAAGSPTPTDPASGDKIMLTITVER